MAKGMEQLEVNLPPEQVQIHSRVRRVLHRGQAHAADYKSLVILAHIALPISTHGKEWAGLTFRLSNHADECCQI